MTSATESRPWFRRFGRRLPVVAFWLILLGVAQWYAVRNDLGPLQLVGRLIELLRTPYGPLIFVVVYALRPLVLFSATLLSVAAGFVFGPVGGVIYATVGGNSSALVAYLLGRWLGKGLLEESTGAVARYAERLRQNSFTSVLTMRLLLVPFDLINYLAGFLRIDWRAFTLATILGSLPGTLAFVLFGASIDQFDGRLPRFNPLVLLASVAILVISLIVARVFRRRDAVNE